MTMDLERGTMRHWVLGTDGVKRWADTNEPMGKPGLPGEHYAWRMQRMMTMPKCHDCGKFCHPVEWQIIYSGALLEPQEEIYKCASCVEKKGSFEPQHGIKPEYSCGKFPAVTPAPTFADGMTGDDDRRFLELTNDLTHNA